MHAGMQLCDEQYIATYTTESCKYAPIFCMLELGTTEEGGYTRDHDISTWQPLPTNEYYVGVQYLHFSWLMVKIQAK